MLCDMVAPQMSIPLLSSKMVAISCGHFEHSRQKGTKSVEQIKYINAKSMHTKKHLELRIKWRNTRSQLLQFFNQRVPTRDV